MSLLRKLLRLPTKQDTITEGLMAYQLMRSYERVFIGPDGNIHSDGRIILADLARQCGLVTSTPVRKVDGSISVEDMLINEGRRITLLGIYKRIYNKKANLADGLSTEEEDQIANNLIQEIQET
jgi:hypothetical protein